MQTDTIHFKLDSSILTDRSVNDWDILYINSSRESSWIILQYLYPKVIKKSKRMFDRLV